MTTTLNAATAVFNRPAARFDGGPPRCPRFGAGSLPPRALVRWLETEQGAVSAIRRTPESQTLFEAGKAGEPVVVRAMLRAGWQVTLPADRDDPAMRGRSHQAGRFHYRQARILCDPQRATAVFNRPAARFNGDRLDVRASALGRCRRALWYAAPGQPVTNRPRRSRRSCWRRARRSNRSSFERCCAPAGK